jgi:hypothetical protein
MVGRKKNAVQGTMRDTHEADAMRDALQYLIASDIPAQHKRVLMEAVTLALRTAGAAEDHAASMREASGEWLPHETTLIGSSLEGKIARSWQHADEILMRLSAELHRRPQDVRAKACELGLGRGVDYALARKTPVPNVGE